ncbi:hypothetical protein Tco_0364710 [Tanacetum coccineum]
MQATARIGFINQFKHQLEEGNAVTLQHIGVPSVIVGTVITIQEDEGWCPEKLRLGLMIGGAEVHGLDETRTMSLSLFNDEVQAIVGRSAYQLCDNEFDGLFSSEITSLIGTKYAFKVVIDDYNAKKLLPVFSVLSLSNDPDIINSIIPCATPVKDNEASSKTAGYSHLDLESWTDENTNTKIAHKMHGYKSL